MKKIKNWKNALQKFIQKWESKKEVIGALVCGSYITGNPSNHSDLDIEILLKSKTPWTESGNEIIDGFLIEYFARPYKKHCEEFEEDYKSRSKIEAHMFTTGKVLFDKTGELDKLIKIAKKYMVKKYTPQSKIEIKNIKYRLWDRCDNLEEVFEANSKEFFFVFYVHLKDLFEIYSKFLQFDSIPAHKLKRFLINKEEKKKYHINNFPDKAFVKMYVDAINIKDKLKMMKEYQKLTKHVLNKMGGFNIDGWKIKSPAK